MQPQCILLGRFETTCFQKTKRYFFLQFDSSLLNFQNYFSNLDFKGVNVGHYAIFNEIYTCFYISQSLEQKNIYIQGKPVRKCGVRVGKTWPICQHNYLQKCKNYKPQNMKVSTIFVGLCGQNSNSQWTSKTIQSKQFSLNLIF